MSVVQFGLVAARQPNPRGQGNYLGTVTARRNTLAHPAAHAAVAVPTTPGAKTTPHLLSPPTAQDLVADAIAEWRTSLVDAVGASTLADITLLGDALLDLSAAHPSGVAQLFAGRPTQLANLVREMAAVPQARRQARAVVDHASEHAQRYGLAPTYLALGVATWTEQVPEAAPTALGAASEPDAALAALAEVTNLGKITAITRRFRSPRSDVGRTASEQESSDNLPNPARLQSEPPTTADVDADAPTTETPMPAAEGGGADTGSGETLPPGEVIELRPGPHSQAGSTTLELPEPRTRVVRAPVLLRPITIKHDAAGGTFTFTLEATAQINPVVATTLRAHGALLDPGTLAESTTTDSGFQPECALDRIASLGQAVLGDFRMDRRMLVGTFVHPGQALVTDLDELAPELVRHEVVAALADVPQAKDALRRIELPGTALGDPDPAHERGVGDLDADQRRALAAYATGAHLLLDTPLGSDGVGTVAAIIADAAATGRSVLYVTGHRRAAEALRESLHHLDLDELLLDVPPTATWREEVTNRLLSAMTYEPHPFDTEAAARRRDALCAVRGQLAGYIEALHRVREPWGASAYHALQALARLTARRPAPATSVRLAESVVLGLPAAVRAQVAADLEVAAELGAFNPRVTDTPWNGANLLDREAADQALLRLERLVRTTLPLLRRQIAEVAAVTGLAWPACVAAFGEQLRMLNGMRGTLDVFHPMVFERSVADLVQACGSRRWRAANSVTMGSLTRRRLRKRARGMVRPGVRLDNLHASLQRVEAQRLTWERHTRRGGWPTLPPGLSGIEATYEAARIDLDLLEPVLAGTASGARLAHLTFEELEERLGAFLDDAQVLGDLPTREAALRRVRGVGLGPLLDDLAERQCEAYEVAAELELAWWGSVFEQILAQDPTLAEQDGASLDALARRFRLLDNQQVTGLSVPIRAAVRANLGEVMLGERAMAESLYRKLVSGGLTSLRQLIADHPKVVHRLRPALVSTPTLVPHLLPAERQVDLVVLDAIAHVDLPVLLAALSRGKQVIAVGDLRAASGSALPELAEILPRITLPSRAALRDPGLTRLLARHGYADVLRIAPTPRTEALVQFDVVHGSGLPNPRSGTVESTPPEVARAVELAIEHATSRPTQTLAVVALTATHAERIREALAVAIRAEPTLAAYFDPLRPEPVVVVDATGVAGLTRDTLLLTFGFGRTPHGRVLHRFGAISEPGGEALLLGALGVARRRLHVLSCFTAEELLADRLRGPGALLIAELLEFVQERSGFAERLPLGNGIEGADATDRLLADIADRLWRQGFLVETGFGLPGGERIPLVVGHPDLPDQLLVAVLTDDAAYTQEPSIRVRDRQVAERLERLGWVVTQMWSAAAFLDPVAEADRVRRLVLDVRAERLAGGNL